MWAVTLKGLLGRKFRLLLTSISVVLGVGFVAGTLVFTDTLGHVFDNLFAQVNSGQDAVVRSRLPFKVNVPGGGTQADRAPVPDSLVTLVRSTPGVQVAAGSIQGIALVVGRDGKAVQGQAPTLGISWGSVARLNRALNLTSGTRPNGPHDVALDQSTAAKAGVRVGDPVRMVFLTVAPETFRVSGVFRFGDAGNLAGATLSAFEPTTAQRVMGRVGQWDQIDVVANPGVSQVQLRDRLTAQLDRRGLGGRYEALTATAVAQETASDIKKNLAFFGDLLLAFALVALFVGGFSIYNTFSIIVAQRARELGLLRAVGASGAQVTASVVAESLTIGLFSSVVGLGFGVGLAAGLEAVLKAVGIDLPSGGVQVQARTVIVALVIGTLVTVASALAPARRAARVPPIAALLGQTTTSSSGRRRFIIGGAVAGIGLVIGGVGLFGNISSASVPGGGAGLVGVGGLAVFVGTAMLSPLIAGPAARLLGWPSVRLRGITGELARENAMRNTRRTASTAAALTIGLALVTLVSILGASAKTSFSRAVDRTNRADFQLAGRNFGGISPEAAAAVRTALPGSTVVEFRPGTWQYRGQGEQLIGVTADLQTVVDIGLRPGADLRGFATSGVLVYKDAAKDHHWTVGSVIPMRFSATGTRPEVVRGIYDDNQGLNVGFSSYLLSMRDYQANYATQLDLGAAVRRPPGTSVAAARAVVDRTVTAYPNVQVQDQAQAKAAQVKQFNAILNLMYALLLLAILIALIGIVNTLALSIYERTRELGLLRAVGMSRAQMRRMVRSEAVIISLFGTLMGLVIGLAFGRAIVASLSKQNIAFSVPVGQLVAFVVLAGLAGLLAGTMPGRRAARLDVLQAITAT